MRLKTGAALPPLVAMPQYDRDAQALGIVHFGIGAFHRAHQAVYTDEAMNAGDRDWMITGVSLRSAGVAEQLNPQDGLYTVTAKGGEGNQIRLVGAVRNVLVASVDATAVVDAIAAASTRIVSFTITEKGYCRAPDGSLDFDLADDSSVYRYLAAGLRQRHDAGGAGLTLLSCDNLANNGAQLSRLMSEYLERHDPALRPWFERECTCPATMIDRIVPATTPADRTAIETSLGLRDEGAILTEPFTQWVIEDRFAGLRPRWEAMGAQFANDVAPFETAKLRMLNGAHSALAYIGLAQGYETVHQAMGDPGIADLVRSLMLDEAAPTLSPAPGQDLVGYADALIERFRNPALNHRLIQIAMDGSQKIPQRWLETLACRQRVALPSPAILQALAAWLLHVRGDVRPVDDPLANDLAALWQTHGVHGIVAVIFASTGFFGGIWQPGPADTEYLSRLIGQH